MLHLLTHLGLATCITTHIAICMYSNVSLFKKNDANVAMVGTVMPACTDAGLKPDNNGYGLGNLKILVSYATLHYWIMFLLIYFLPKSVYSLWVYESSEPQN